MSTNLMLRCVSHDPYMSSDNVGRNLEYLPQIREDLKNRDKLVEFYNLCEYWDFDIGDQYRNATIRFLAWHPHCDLEIWDEYGTWYPLEAPEEKEDELKGIGVNTVLGTALSVTEDEDGVSIKFQLNDDGVRLMKRMQRNLGPYSIYKKEDND